MDTAALDLVGHRVALANQLRAHLNAFYPAPVGLFHELDGQMSIKFLTRFDCQDRADWLTAKRVASFLAGIRYCGSTTAENMHARIAAARGATGDVGAAAVHVTRALLSALRGLVEQIEVLTGQITEQLHAHVDAHVLPACPAPGRFVPPGCWRRSVTLGAGSRPRKRPPRWPGLRPRPGSRGKSRIVGFRWAVDRQLRDALVEWAGDSRLSNPWAADIYRRARGRGCDHPHAVRVLARAWVYVLWRCWQDGTAYEPDRHAALQRLVNPTESVAA